MLVNPSINIAIGNYGKNCIDSFHKHFMEREKDLKNYASFYNLEQEDNTLKYFSVHQNELKDNITLNNEQNIDNQYSSDDIQFFFKDFVNSIYNNQINLLEQLNTQVNFEIVNVNIILSSFENLNAELAENLIKSIKELCDEGMISHILVKTFVLLSKDGKLLKPQEEIFTYKNLEKLKVIQKDNNSIFRNIIFIDDKNTSAVYLNINTASIVFVLNEFITYFMTNHYNMLGNLMNSEYLSIGLGMLYFDDIFFKKSFRSKIIDAKIVREQLDPAEHLIITSHYSKIRDEFFMPVVNKTAFGDINTLANACKNLELHENCTLKSYKFLLSHLTGDFKAVPLKDPLPHSKKISINDALYQLIQNTFPALNGVDIMEYKELLDEIDSLKVQIENHKKENEDGLLNDKIAEIEKKLTEKKNIATEQKLQIKNTLQEFKRKDQPAIRKQIESYNLARIKELQKKRADLLTAFNNRFLLLRLFTRAAHNRETALIEREIVQIQTIQEDTQQTFEKFDTTVQQLYKVINNLEEKYKNLKSAINFILDLQKKYNEEFNRCKLFNYLFNRHVIDEKILKVYFENNKLSLLSNIKDTIVHINTTSFSSSKFENYFKEKIDKSINEIIDFKMVNYLLNKYDALNLLKKAEPQKDISSLIKISVPFFNADNAFINNNSHQLILHKDHNDIDTRNLKDKLSQIFNVVPQQIRTLNPNKFSLVKIDIIPDFTSLVKYNMAKKRYDGET
jgi:hypothetical protein